MAEAIAKAVRRRALHEDGRADDLRFWLSRTPGERIAHVTELVCEHYGFDLASPPRLQRVHRLLHR